MGSTIKYYDNGTKQWTQQLGSTSSETGFGVTVDSSNKIYVTGWTEGNLDNNTSLGSEDIILVKYYDNGTKQWTQQLGTSSAERGKSVSVDSSNNIYVTGDTYGGLDGNINSGNSDIFLVKYNSSGTKLWTQQLGSSGFDTAEGITLDSSNNIYISGYTTKGLDGNTWLGVQDFFLVKYNSSGTKQWTQQSGSNSGDYGYGTAVDSSDNIYITGSTSGGIGGNTNDGGSDIFLVKYNSSGVLQ